MEKKKLVLYLHFLGQLNGEVRHLLFFLPGTVSRLRPIQL